MSGYADLLARFASRHFDALLSHVISSTVFLAAVLLLLAILRNRLTAGARFWLALIGIAKFAIPGALVMPFVTLLAGGAIDRGATPLDLPLQLLGGTFRFAPAAPAPRVGVAIALVVWLGVAFALMVRRAIARHRLVAVSVRTALPPLPREIRALSIARERLGVRQSIDIARSPLPEAPAVLRVLRPLVVLPVTGCDELSDSELESLLRHECAHVARQDNLIARIESVVCAFFWFHPLIWIAQRMTVIERERACDEVVAGSADERKTYLAALRKFCHAAIAPRLPGVSCMATANLKQRIDHVMHYEALKEHSPAPRRVAFVATCALVLFTVAAGLVRTETAFAAESSSDARPYSVKVTATRSGDFTTLTAHVRELATGKIISAPTVTMGQSRRATMRSGSSPGSDVLFELRPGAGTSIVVDVTIQQDGKLVDKSTLHVVPKDGAAETKYSGQPITLTLTDADLRDLIGTFGQLTGYEMKMPDDVQGKVSVAWQNVPWDEAFATLLDENGLTYRIEGQTIHITKK